jgi:hypothetical protein
MSDFINKSDIHTYKQLQTITPQTGDVLMDTDRGLLVLGDGETKGGCAPLCNHSPSFFAYLGAPTAVTCTLADTYYPVTEGVMTFNILQNWGVSGDNLMYNSPVPRYIEVDWHASFSVSTIPAKATVTFAFTIDGVVFTPSELTSYAERLILQASGTTVAKLEYGNVTDMVLKSDGAGDIVTLHQLSITGREFPGVL